MNKKPKKKFIPQKTPRYLPGSAKLDFIIEDLKMINGHRYRVFAAKCYIDTKPPQLPPYNYADKRRFKIDTTRLVAIEKENKKLVCKINTINRSKAVTDCWMNYRPPVKKWVQRNKILRGITERNKRVYNGILKSVSYYRTSDFRDYWEKALKRINYVCKFPVTIMDKKSIDQVVREQPSISGGLGLAVSRPRAYMDFKIKGGLRLGQILIELYLDYAPLTVTNFLTICSGQHGLKYKNCHIHNGLKNKYFEIGDMTKDNGKGGFSIYGPTFDEELSILQHTKQGVVSMVRVKNSSKNEVNSIFSITLGAMPEFNGKRSVFGKVIKGNKVLCKVNDMLKKCGTPTVTIIISRCGIAYIPETPTAANEKCCLEKP